MKADGNAEFASQYWPLVQKWARFLRDKGFDPERQLCTDDFAGHLAHNVNLSAKAIVALGCYAMLRQDVAALASSPAPVGDLSTAKKKGGSRIKSGMTKGAVTRVNRVTSIRLSYADLSAGFRALFDISSRLRGNRSLMLGRSRLVLRGTDERCEVKSYIASAKRFGYGRRLSVHDGHGSRFRGNDEWVGVVREIASAFVWTAKLRRLRRTPDT